MINLNDKKGFSFIEMMVVLGIFTIITAGTYRVIVMGESTTHEGLTHIEISQDVRLGIDKMVNELRNAESSTINIPSAGVITFQVLNNSNTIQYALGANPNEDRLTRTEAGVDTILCKNIGSIVFSPSPFSGNTVTIDLQAEKKFGKSMRDLTAALNVDVRVRN